MESIIHKHNTDYSDKNKILIPELYMDLEANIQQYLIF